jgi:hypothetical protein
MGRLCFAGVGIQALVWAGISRRRSRSTTVPRIGSMETIPASPHDPDGLRPVRDRGPKLALDARLEPLRAAGS